MRIAHFGRTIEFAWENAGLDSIQWAAFYGDCAHEVLEVTKGHRITLTYKLYFSRIGRLARPVSSPEQLPLYNTVGDMLKEREFLRQGGSSYRVHLPLWPYLSCRRHPWLLLPTSICAFNQVRNQVDPSWIQRRRSGDLLGFYFAWLEGWHTSDCAKQVR